MKIKRIFLSIALIALMLSAVPHISYASTTKATFLGPIVPVECKCTDQAIQGGKGTETVTTAPDYGCVLQVVQNSVNFGITISIILFTLYMVLTGFAFITAGDSSEARSKAKTRFTNVIVGLAVLLCAWLLVDYVMKHILYDDTKFGPWNAILAGDPSGKDRCIVATTPTAIFTGTVGIIHGDPGATASTIGSAGTSALSASKAAAYATSNALSSSSGRCAEYVRKALSAGGLTDLDTNHPGNANEYGPYLTKLGFTSVASGSYSASSENIGGIREGDVVVFQAVPGHSSGHIAIYTGSQWVSDYKQKTMSSNPSDYTGGSFTIYRP